MALIDTEAVEELRRCCCAPQQQGQGYRISNQQAGFLESTFQQHGGWRVQAPADAQTKAPGQTRMPTSGDLDGILRGYQSKASPGCGF
jgi:hypothetical protein